MSSARDDALLPLAEAVADQTPVDWEACAGARTGDTGRARLREIASVVAAFRAAAGEPADEGAAPVRVGLFRWGHLEVRERLGGGSFGEVFRAWDTVLEREVALKLWRVEVGSSGGDETRFLREARLLARVRHPNVLTVHGAEIHDGRAGLWTDLVEGETLESLLANSGTLGAEEAALIGVDLCRALAAVHGAGLIHGDVKASNVLRERGGRIVLADFGAGASARTRVLAEMCGTPLAMAPEVLRGQPPTPAADLYALGTLLYRLVTGRYPIELPTLGDLLDAHGRGALVPLADRRPDLPVAFTEAVMRALAARPDERYASAGAMEQALARTLPENGLPDRISRHSRPARLPFVAALAVAVAVLVYVGLKRSRPSLPPAQVRTLAVLPMATADGAADEAFLGPGIADDLSRLLSAVPGLRVTPAASALRWIDGHADPREIGRDLDVPAFLGGTFSRSGDALRLELELVHTRDGSVIWRNSTAGRIDDLPGLERKVAERLVKVLAIARTPAVEAALRPPPSADIEVSHAVLAGYYFAGRRTTAALERSVAMFEKAVRLGPGHPDAHAGLARSYALLATADPLAMTPQQAWRRARHAAVQALDLDPKLAAAHLALGTVAFRGDWNWPSAELELRRAIELAPGEAAGHQVYAELLSVVGRHEEAIAVARRAVDLDPTSPVVRTSAGTVLLEAGHFDEAVEQFQAAIAADPTFYPAYAALGGVHEERGEFDEAVSEWRSSLALSGAPTEDVDALGQAYASLGMTGVWHWRLTRLEERARNELVSPALVARAHAALGHREEALRWLQRAVEERDDQFLRCKAEPAFDELRHDVRFAALTGQLHLEKAVLAEAPAGADRAIRPLTVEMALYRNREGRSESLAAGASVRPGDRLFMAVTSEEPVYLYVFNEDRQGSLFVLFPLPDLEISNPIPPRQRHRLPGRQQGSTQDWVVTSAGGRETILVVAARQPSLEVEQEIAHLRVAAVGRPVELIPPQPTAVVALRGVGGLANSTPASSARPGSRLTVLAARLAEAARRGDVWLKEFVLDNSGL